MNESQLPPVLLIEDLARILNTSVRTINKRRASRRFPFTELARIDRKARWSRDAVLAIVNGTRSSKAVR